MTDNTLNLFSQPMKKGAEASEELHDIEKTAGSELDDLRVQQMVGNTFLAFYDVDDWMDSKTAPDTFEFDSKIGKFYMTKNKKAHRRLVASGEIVFSPLEIEKFIHSQDGTLADFVDAMRADIYAVKKMDPGAKVVADKVYRQAAEADKS